MGVSHTGVVCVVACQRKLKSIMLFPTTKETHENQKGTVSMIEKKIRCLYVYTKSVWKPIPAPPLCV